VSVESSLDLEDLFAGLEGVTYSPEGIDFSLPMTEDFGFNMEFDAFTLPVDDNTVEMKMEDIFTIPRMEDFNLDIDPSTAVNGPLFDSFINFDGHN